MWILRLMGHFGVIFIVLYKNVGLYKLLNHFHWCRKNILKYNRSCNVVFAWKYFNVSMLQKILLSKYDWRAEINNSSRSWSCGIQFSYEPWLVGSQNCKIDGQKMVCEVALNCSTICFNGKWELNINVMV